MTREEAIKTIQQCLSGIDISLSVKTKEALEFLVPELKESEDERIRKRLITLIRVLDSSFFTGNNPSKEQCLAYLEKQKEQKPNDDPLNDPKFIKGFDTGREVQRIFDEKKPAEWSEEDKNRIQRICDFLWKNRKGDTDTIYQIEKDADWLKSLRPDSYKNCNSRWKPSDEQMAALYSAARESPIIKENGNYLYDLYEQLKKL